MTGFIRPRDYGSATAASMWWKPGFPPLRFGRRNRLWRERLAEVEVQAAVSLKLLSGHNLVNRSQQFFHGKRFQEQKVHAAGRLAENLEFVGKGRGHDDGLIGPEFLEAGDEFVPPAFPAWKNPL